MLYVQCVSVYLSFQGGQFSYVFGVFSSANDCWRNRSRTNILGAQGTILLFLHMNANGPPLGMSMSSKGAEYTGIVAIGVLFVVALCDCGIRGKRCRSGDC